VKRLPTVPRRAALLLALWPGWPVMGATPASLFALVDRIADSPALTPKTVAGLTGISLHEAGGDASFGFYAGRKAVGASGIGMAIDLRIPRPAGGATAGPLLNIDISGPCLTQRMVEDHFGPLRLIDVPHGHSPAERTSYATTTGNSIRFSFASTRDECLQTITQGRRG
jgi:hypothetical protein